MTWQDQRPPSWTQLATLSVRDVRSLAHLVGTRLKGYEIEGMTRSAAMAVSGRLPNEALAGRSPVTAWLERARVAILHQECPS